VYTLGVQGLYPPPQQQMNDQWGFDRWRYKLIKGLSRAIWLEPGGGGYPGGETLSRCDMTMHLHGRCTVCSKGGSEGIVAQGNTVIMRNNDAPAWQVYDLEQKGGSIIGGVIQLLQARKKNPPPPRDPTLPPKPAGQTVGSFKNGLQSLPQAIASNIGDRIRYFSNSPPPCTLLQRASSHLGTVYL